MKPPKSDFRSGALAFVLLFSALAGAVALKGDRCTFVAGPTSTLDRIAAAPTYWAYQLMRDRTQANIVTLSAYAVLILVVVFFGHRALNKALILPGILKRKRKEAAYFRQAQKAARAQLSRGEKVLEAREELSIREEAKELFHSTFPAERALEREIHKIRVRRNAERASETDDERHARLELQIRERHRIVADIRKSEPRDQRIMRLVEIETDRIEAQERARLGIPREIQLVKEIDRAQLRHEATEAVRRNESDASKISREVERMRIRDLAKILYQEQKIKRRTSADR